MLKYLSIFPLLLLLWVFPSMAQFPHCPIFKTHDWISEADYNVSQDTVKQLVKWLNETPISWEYEQRTKANLYVLQWMTSHPSKKWNWSSQCFGPLDDHLELMYAFLQASLYYSLTHENSSDLKREVYVLQCLSKKIEQSKQYDEKEEWKEIVKAVRRHRELQYLEKCKGQSKPN